MTKTQLENWKCSPVSLTMSQRSQNSLNVFAIVFVFVFAIVFVFAFVFFGFNFSKVFPFSVPEYFLPVKKHPDSSLTMKRNGFIVVSLTVTMMMAGKSPSVGLLSAQWPPLGESTRFSTRQLLCHKHALGTPRNIQFSTPLSQVLLQNYCSKSKIVLSYFPQHSLYFYYIKKYKIILLFFSTLKFSQGIWKYVSILAQKQEEGVFF